MSEISHGSRLEDGTSDLIETALYGIPDETTTVLNYLHDSRKVVEVDLNETIDPRPAIVTISPHNMDRGDVNVAYWKISGQPIRSPEGSLEPFEAQLFCWRGPYSTTYSLLTKDRMPTESELDLTTRSMRLLGEYPIHDELSRRRRGAVRRLLAGFLGQET